MGEKTARADAAANHSEIMYLGRCDANTVLAEAAALKAVKISYMCASGPLTSSFFC